MAKTVYLGMIGDIMHPGLINIINEGAKYGEVMIGLFTDKAIATHKRLPYLTYDQRKNVIENIRGVSSIVPQDEWSYVPNLIYYKPDYIIHGDDWQEGPDKYIRDEVFKVMESLGGKVIEIPYTKGITSSGLAEELESLGTTPQARLKCLRRLITAKPIVRIMESHCGLTGLIIEHTKVEVGDETREFDGMWASSLTDSTSKGKPDIEAVDLTTRLHDLNDSLEVTTKPVIYDGDTGGKTEHFVFTVRTLERLGVSAVIIEDKVGLKQNSLFGTDAVQTQDSREKHSVMNYNKGIFIDIFPVDIVPDNEDERNSFYMRVQEKRSSVINVGRKLGVFSQTPSFIRQTLKRFLHQVLKPYRNRHLCDLINEYNELELLCSSYNGVDSSVFSMPMDTSSYSKLFYLEDYIDSILLDFEFMKIPVARNYDHALQQLYGDYHQLIITHNHTAIFDAEKSYLNYFK